MESLWGYADNHHNQHSMDQLGQKLLWTTLELEKLKSEVVEEVRKNKEHVKQLIHLLKLAIQERDEARNQLQRFLITDTAATTTTTLTTSNITESNCSLSETYTHRGPSPPMSPDHASLVVDTLAKGRALPVKGKLLQAVLEAGPLLQTLLLAGPLPRWRNPPLVQPFQVPPVSIKGREADVLGRRPGYLVRQGNLEGCYGLVSNFGNVGSGTCNASSMVSGLGFDSLGKRRRLC